MKIKTVLSKLVTEAQKKKLGEFLKSKKDLNRRSGLILTC